jgi:hypothetical protein
MKAHAVHKLYIILYALSYNKWSPQTVHDNHGWFPPFHLWEGLGAGFRVSLQSLSNYGAVGEATSLGARQVTIMQKVQLYLNFSFFLALGLLSTRQGSSTTEAHKVNHITGGRNRGRAKRECVREREKDIDIICTFTVGIRWHGFILTTIVYELDEVTTMK